MFYRLFVFVLFVLTPPELLKYVTLVTIVKKIKGSHTIKLTIMANIL